MADLQSFINKWNGKYPDFDGYYGAQCVDLVQYWSQELGGGRFTGNAKDIYGQFSGFYDSIANTPSNLPQPGDIIVWNGALSGSGGAGHTSIYVNGNLNSFTSFDVNFPSGSPAHLQSHNWNNVVGWLHPKSGVQSENMATPVNTSTNRIIHSEMEGWDYRKTHAGEYDKLFEGWNGSDLEAMVWSKWNQNSAFREARERNRIFFEKYGSVIDELGSRPTKAQYDEAMAKLAAEAGKVEAANKKAEEALAEAKKLAEQKTEDSKLLDEGSGAFAWITKLFNRIKRK